MFTRIITHNDLDGLVSASICAGIHEIESIEFTGPNIISQRGISATESDIVCDLPYPGNCGLWFDHHIGNYQELKRLGKDPKKLPGLFAAEKSCTRVVYKYYKSEYDFPYYINETISETDKIDSFDFKTIEEWRKETPSKIINDSLKAKFSDNKEMYRYYRSLIFRFLEKDMYSISKNKDVIKYYNNYLQEEKKMLSLIEKMTFFNEKDTKKEIAIIDITEMNKKISIVRNLAQIIYPQIKSVFLVQSLFKDNHKSNDFSISGSLTINNNGIQKDIGEIMRVLNIGDGHPGAGSGQVFCKSKNDMIKIKEKMVNTIVELWYS